MTDLWSLPRTARLGQEEFPIRWDWRTALRLLQILEKEQQAPVLRWLRAVELFYCRPVPRRLLGEACRFLADFLEMGRPGKPGLRLLDWQADAQEIISDINRVAGREVRNENAHWWTFLSWFHAIGEGQLSALVAVRSKLARGEKLSAGEQEFYRRNRDRVRLEPASDPEKERLERLLADPR